MSINLNTKNLLLAGIAVLTVGGGIALYMYNRENKKKIAQLEKEIEQLKTLAPHVQVIAAKVASNDQTFEDINENVEENNKDVDYFKKCLYSMENQLQKTDEDYRLPSKKKRRRKKSNKRRHRGRNNDNEQIRHRRRSDRRKHYQSDSESESESDSESEDEFDAKNYVSRAMRSRMD